MAVLVFVKEFFQNAAHLSDLAAAGGDRGDVLAEMGADGLGDFASGAADAAAEAERAAFEVGDLGLELEQAGEFLFAEFEGLDGFIEGFHKEGWS